MKFPEEVAFKPPSAPHTDTKIMKIISAAVFVALVNALVLATPIDVAERAICTTVPCDGPKLPPPPNVQ